MTVFCNRSDCHNWEDECCESYESITIDENGCQNYSPINFDDFKDQTEDE